LLRSFPRKRPALPKLNRLYRSSFLAAYRGPKDSPPGKKASGPKAFAKGRLRGGYLGQTAAAPSWHGSCSVSRVPALAGAEKER